eukprot:CAMPEP_0116088562 /NCGR_PEP_ID=MMETSP0327-20121206/5935_1 /TAXON_ID=44447 /ORGANISM="Pseudo-nitzschia delicatissima, Strain B596" /LENGTH=655 /DNA_ID=CAMNT_0003579649 /DNA_START=104 /DNA_END=2071 /DNA_ORIENTATION=-
MALQLTIIITLAALIYRKICRIHKKLNAPEAVPGFPSRPRPHWLVGHLMVLRGAEMKVVKKKKFKAGLRLRIEEEEEEEEDEDEETTNTSLSFVQGYRRVYCDHADPETGVGSFWFFHIPCVSVLRGEDAKKVMCSSSFRKSIWIVNSHTKQLLGQNTLLALMGKEWRHYRSAVHKSFTSGVVKQSRPFVYQIGNTLVDALLKKIKETELSSAEADDYSNGDESSQDETIPSSSPLATSTEASTTNPVDILPLMKMATIDVFGLVALRSNGVDFGCTRNLELSPIASAFDTLTTEYSARLKRPWDPFSFLYSLPTKANRDYHRKQSMIRSFVAEQIAKTRARMSNTDIGEGQQDAKKEQCDMLTNLIRAADSEMSQRQTKMSNKAHDEALGDILVTLLFAGYDTTSIALTYALYLLAKNPTKKAKCLAEIDAVFASENFSGEINSGKTLPPGPDEFPYTKGVILEALRLFPPAPSTSRTIEKPIKFKTTNSCNDDTILTLREGQMVMLPIWSIQRSELNYPRPNEMIPERWVRRKRKLQNPCDCTSETSLWEVRPENDSRDETTAQCDTVDATVDEDEDTSIAPANRDAFCAFAAGARNCVGKNLAVEESVILLACLVHKLSFELVSETYEATPLLHAVVQQPDDNLPMIVRPRQ